LNIEGKRSGEGFVAHKAMLVTALSRALADRVSLMDLTIGRKGLLGYLKALGGSNVVKVIPSNGSASETQATAKKLKVICGANTSYLADNDWIGEKTPITFCEVRVSPSNTVTPNVGANELAEALAKVLPFTAKGDDRPVLACVKFEAKDGKLNLVSADGFRLAVVTLDYADGEGQALINRDELKGVANALRRAKRVRVSFEAGGESIGGYSLIIDTELIRYKWTSLNGNYPDWQKLIPTDFNCLAHFDTVEAIKAVNSLKVLANAKAYPIDLVIGNGKLVMANIEDKGQADIVVDTDGEGFVRLDGQYLANALKACGGMVDFKLSSPIAPMLFTVNGYQLVVMPMITEKAQEYQKAKQAEAKQVEPTEPEAEQATEPVAEPVKAKQAEAKQVEPTEPEAEQATEPVAEPVKAKRSRAKVKTA
jgi:DNA polymerase-3 subunit beta